MTIDEEFHIVIRCPTCQHIVEAWPEEVTRADYSEEQSSDRERTEEIDLDCETCGEEFSVTVRAHWAGWEVFLSDRPSHTGIFEHFDYRYDEWIEAQPKGTFNEGLREWRQMLHSIGDRKSGSSPVNRMLLVQLFSIVEAYLADTIANLALSDPNVVLKIIEWHPDLKHETVSLTRIAKETSLARDILLDRIRRTQFHRFDHVNGMLRAAIGHDFLPTEKAVRDAVVKSTGIRHACVHGNGRDREGNALSDVTAQYLSDLAGHFSAIVERLAYRIEIGPET